MEGCPPVLSDSFERDDSTDLGSNWTEVSGNWEIDTNQLTVTSSGAIATSTQSRATPYVFSVGVTPSADDQQPRIIVNYVDSSNYIFIEVHAAAGDFKSIFLYEKSGGVDTLLSYVGHVAHTASSYTVQVCVKEDEVIAIVVGSSLTVWADVTVTSNTIGVGAGNANEPKFDSVLLTPHYDDNTACPDCTVTCDYFTDIFNRSDDTDLDDGWSEEAGSWSISSNALTTSSTSAICVTTSDLAPEYVVDAPITMTSGQWYSVVLGYVDSTHYVEVRLKYTMGRGYVEFYVNGSLSESINRADSFSNSGMVVCVTDTIIHAMIGTIDNNVYVGSSMIAVPTGAVGVKTVTQVPATFSSFTVQKHEEACHVCYTCGTCNYPIPRQMVVSFSSVTDDLCAGCSTKFSTSYVLELFNLDACIWRYQENDWNCRTDCVPDTTPTGLWITAKYELLAISGTTYWVLRVLVSTCNCCYPTSTGGAEASFYWNTGVVFPALPDCDCEGPNTLVRTYAQPGNATCDWTSAGGTIEVV